MAEDRLAYLLDELLETLKEFIRKNKVTPEEYRKAVLFLHETGQIGEMPLMADVFLETTVDEVAYGHRAGAGFVSAIEGPYYIEEAPELEPPYELPRRENEPGDVLFFSGTVRDEDGNPLAGAVLDMWQADATGVYSKFDVAAHTRAKNSVNRRGLARHSLDEYLTPDPPGLRISRGWVPCIGPCERVARARPEQKFAEDFPPSSFGFTFDRIGIVVAIRIPPFPALIYSTVPTSVSFLSASFATVFFTSYSSGLCSMPGVNMAIASVRGSNFTMVFAASLTS